MRKAFSVVLMAAALLLSSATLYETGNGYCVLFPQNGRDMFGVEQRNVFLLRENQVSLIPQVAFEGNARDCGVLIPVPSLPKLASADAGIFSQLSFMTQPLVRSRNDGCGCDGETNVVSPAFATMREDGAVVDTRDSGVDLVFEQLVGMYQAAVLQAGNAADLAEWLQRNGYNYRAQDSLALQDYVERNWYFVAMRLDTAQVSGYIGGWWGATTTPAEITFAANPDSILYPLSVTAISTQRSADVLVYAIGDKPLRFEQARLEYANAITPDEYDAIERNWPAVADVLRPGQFVTKLRRKFRKDEMDRDFVVYSVADRREYREIIYQDSGGFGFAALVLFVFAIRLFRDEKTKGRIRPGGAGAVGD